MLLNFSLRYAIPFNRSHHLKIHEVYDDGLKVFLPYRRSNLNHLRGIHACGLATLAEFTAGTTLLHTMKSEDFRLIMKELRMTYHFQARMDVYAECRISAGRIKDEIISPLQHSDAVFIQLTIEVYDFSKNHVCTGEVNWQVKKWEKVKSKK